MTLSFTYITHMQQKATLKKSAQGGIFIVMIYYAFVGRRNAIICACIKQLFGKRHRLFGVADMPQVVQERVRRRQHSQRFR